eukprot:CAMPEP_0171284894 /NCGR_PEP_ID=MMETSP0790-20130122/68176_1 /TAXON_ID=2925 /ORGANISM="Alexandrium catenella, Strain OF101" /LENGTH=77 /DNA_ID=CAMNT_0011754209 /DNA_START=16 /DNA_END=246 /DNA_ORIENTATION=-
MDLPWLADVMPGAGNNSAAPPPCAWSPVDGYCTLDGSAITDWWATFPGVASGTFQMLLSLALVPFLTSKPQLHWLLS